MVKSEADWIGELAAAVARDADLNYRSSLEHITERCQSPIERLLAAAMLAEPIEGISLLRNTNNQTLPFDSLMHGEGFGGVEWVGAIYPQMAVGPYVADFYFEAFDQDTGKRWYAAILECDGHDYHERTKEQARRDKKRDRWFQARGISVFRFTGSEIWQDPVACVVEFGEAFWAASRGHFGVGSR